MWLDTAASNHRVQLQRHIAPFAGVCMKASGFLIAKIWQRRYVVVDDDRRVVWWNRAEDANDAPKGIHFLASPPTQAKMGARALKLAPRGYTNADLVVPYSASDIPGGLLVTHYLCALNNDDANRLRRAIYGTGLHDDTQSKTVYSAVPSDKTTSFDGDLSPPPTARRTSSTATTTEMALSPPPTGRRTSSTTTTTSETQPQSELRRRLSSPPRLRSVDDVPQTSPRVAPQSTTT